MRAETLSLDLSQQYGPGIAQQAMAAVSYSHLWISSVMAGVWSDCDLCAAELSRD